MTDEDIRAILVRARARKFATFVKDSVFSHVIPRDILDWLEEDEITQFRIYLMGFGLHERPDQRWERRT